MKAVWDKEMVQLLHSMAMPRANFIRPRSEMSHFDFSWLWNRMFSCGGFEMENSKFSFREQGI